MDRPSPLMPDSTPGTLRRGVVFVHGLGNQGPSETILWFGAPLIGWLERWYEARKEPAPLVHHAKLGFTPYDQGHDTFVSRARLRMADPDSGGQCEWVLAEAWWAQSLIRPDFWTMMSRSLGYLGRGMLQLCETALKRARRLFAPGNREESTSPGRIARFVDLANTAGMALVYAVVVILGYPFLTALMVLGRLPIPFVQDFIIQRLVQPLIQVQFGEFAAFLEDELQSANMRRRLAETIKYLIDNEECSEIVVVAHSGGCMISFGTLTDPALQEAEAPLGRGRIKRVVKLITAGSALNKAWRFYPALRRMQRPLPDHIHWVDFWTAYDSVPGGAVDPPSVKGKVCEVFQPSLSVQQAQRLERRLGPNQPPDPKGVFWPESTEVTNRMVILGDHGLYWDNDEQVMVRLVAEIDRTYHRDSRFWRGAGASVLGSDGRTGALREAIRARRERVAFLAFARAMLILAALTVTAWTVVAGLSGDANVGMSSFASATAQVRAIAAMGAGWLQALPVLGWLAGQLRGLPPAVLLGVTLFTPLLVFYVTFGYRWDRRDEKARQQAMTELANTP